ncbi:MAG: methyltransferase [Nitrososphaerales archaeon]|nr:methyltransferase [Nitrososphaerales archaeon]
MRHGSYEPAEDTFLLTDAVRRYCGKNVLEIGVGSGFVTAELSKRSLFVAGTDISRRALRDAKERLKSFKCSNVELICCDGASPFREGCFDLIVFNPPYLPSKKIVDIAVDGGKEGIEVMVKFIVHSLRSISNSGKMVFVSSIISSYDKAIEMLKERGFRVRKIGSRKMFFEDIFVMEASKAR